MASDVFGRPMNEKPTTFKVGRNIAPNPMAPGPQNDALGNMGSDYSPPGESSAFSAGAAPSESLGARQRVEVAHAGPPPPEDGYNHSQDGQLMPRSMRRT